MIQNICVTTHIVFRLIFQNRFLQSFRKVCCDALKVISCSWVTRIENLAGLKDGFGTFLQLKRRHVSRRGRGIQR